MKARLTSSTRINCT